MQTKALNTERRIAFSFKNSERNTDECQSASDEINVKYPLDFMPHHNDDKMSTRIMILTLMINDYDILMVQY